MISGRRVTGKQCGEINSETREKMGAERTGGEKWTRNPNVRKQTVLKKNESKIDDSTSMMEETQM